MQENRRIAVVVFCDFTSSHEVSERISECGRFDLLRVAGHIAIHGEKVEAVFAVLPI